MSERGRKSVGAKEKKENKDNIQTKNKAKQKKYTQAESKNDPKRVPLPFDAILKFYI